MTIGTSPTYTCPMHSNIRQEHSGLCPECGMALVPIKEKSSGHAHAHPQKKFDKHAGHHTNIFKAKFWVSSILSIPVVLYSDILEKLFGWRAPAFPGSFLVPFLLASVIFFYGGWVFIASAARELRARLPGMMTLISLAIVTAYVYSVYAVFAHAGHDLLWELSTLVTIMLLGHWMEMRAVSGAQGALKELSKLLPDTAEVVRGSGTAIIPLAELKKGDVMLVRPGGRIPADGMIGKGTSDVNESIATGESKPVLKKEGDAVIAGTINGDGALEIAVSKIGDDTFLAGVMRLVAQAQASKSRLQILSDRAAFFLTFAAIGAGTVTFAAWMLNGAGAAFAIERLVAVLVIACPHALGLAVPLVASLSTTKAAQNGFLVRQRLALEAARNVDTVLFDKTGTLTQGIFAVQRSSSDEALALAASVDAHSEHPIAKAIVEEARRRALPIKPIEQFRRIPGVGAEAMLEGKKIFVGHRGKADIVVEADGRAIGTLSVSDAIRPEAKEAIDALRAMGVKTVMITGDSADVAKEIAAQLGIGEYFARTAPEQKSEKVKELQQRGQNVAMVGDGVNDAPALAGANLGIAIGAGTNVAIESAGIILVRNDPRDIAKIIRLSRLTYTKMIQNLWWASGYNIIAIPLAAGALAFKGILLQPALAAILMSLSTVIVAANAVRLKGMPLS